MNVEPGKWFCKGEPSPKSQTVLTSVTAAGAVDCSVKEAGTPSQIGATQVKLACAVSNTVMVLLIVSTQPAADEVYVYKMVCVPTPAIAGENIPDDVMPGPE